MCQLNEENKSFQQMALDQQLKNSNKHLKIKYKN